MEYYSVGSCRGKRKIGIAVDKPTDAVNLANMLNYDTKTLEKITREEAESSFLFEKFTKDGYKLRDYSGIEAFILGEIKYKNHGIQKSV